MQKQCRNGVRKTVKTQQDHWETKFEGDSTAEMLKKQCAKRLWQHCKSIGDIILKTDFSNANVTLEYTPVQPYYSLIPSFPVSLPRPHTMVFEWVRSILSRSGSTATMLIMLPGSGNYPQDTPSCNLVVCGLMKTSLLCRLRSQSDVPQQLWKPTQAALFNTCTTYAVAILALCLSLVNQFHLCWWYVSLSSDCMFTNYTTIQVVSLFWLVSLQLQL